MATTVSVFNSSFSQPANIRHGDSYPPYKSFPDNLNNSLVVLFKTLLKFTSLLPSYCSLRGGVRLIGRGGGRLHRD